MKRKSILKGLKTIGKKLLFLPIWLMTILTIVSAVALVLVFAKGWDTSPVSYAVYALSANKTLKFSVRKKIAGEHKDFFVLSCIINEGV